MDTDAFRLSDDKISAILIAGPTASGKSALALRLSAEIDSVVLNADSMQVYDDLDVLTARPSADEMSRAPHRLYGHVDAAVAYSTGQWLKDAAREIDAARKSGRMPIVVGGTGLYFKALTEGLSDVPEIPEEVRTFWRRHARDLGADRLHEELARRDAIMAARLQPTDRQRIVRALEVLHATGRSLSHWQGRKTGALLEPADTQRVVLAPPRAALHKRIEDRFRRMIEAGALDEVASLTARNLDPALPAMKAIGVRPLGAYLSGDCDLDAAVERSIIETRQLAKRQTTWFRGQMKDWERIG